MAKFDKQSLCQNIFFGMTLLHAHAHYICIVCTKYQKASVKALIQDDFLMYALSTLNESYNLRPYILAASSDNKRKGIKTF